eukprot:TRINITY_DN2313_c0_g1_i2.p1 TRINITY_DN2313_c0_g1~~TRINITY_DN2313_c0_g1_i2.p1  ORF type:complete len:2839 (-),score=607.47 TRINITY_DN2313_c0_g1_i2:2918-10357(-)
MHDPTLALSIQTMCCKLLLNMNEQIVRKVEPPLRHALLIRLLDAFASKLGTFASQILQLLKKSQQAPNEEVTTPTLHLEPLRLETVTDTVKDTRQMLKILVVASKTVMWCICQIGAQSAPAGQMGRLMRANLNSEEVGLVLRLFRNAIDCFAAYSKTEQSPAAEEKDFADQIATMCTHVDPRSFQTIIVASLPELYNKAANHNVWMHFTHTFLGLSSTSKHYATVLLPFLVDKIPAMGELDTSGPTPVPTAHSVIALKMFKMVFNSLAIVAENETVLASHISEIVLGCLNHVGKTADPTVYLQLLRTLFRNIASQKFDSLYRDFQPLLPTLLDTLNRLQVTMHHGTRTMHHLIIELCLTFPVRITTLLPFVHLMMKPLVLALQSESSELVLQGLRTLDLLIDNLSASYLDPLLAPVQSELVGALCSHLRGPVYSHTNISIRLLGKLSGSNRRFLVDAPPPLPLQSHDAAFVVTAKLNQPERGNPLGTPQSPPLALDRLVALAVSMLEFQKGSPVVSVASGSLYDMFPFVTPSERVHKIAAANFLVNVLMLYLPTSGEISVQLPTPRQKRKLDPMAQVPDSVNFSSLSRLQSNSKQISKILQALLLMPQQQQDAELIATIDNIVVHFCLLLLEMPSFEPTAALLNRQLSPEVFVDALVAVICTDAPQSHESAKRVLSRLISVAKSLSGSLEVASALPVFDEVSRRLCHCCFHAEWASKSGGAAGISYLAQHMPYDWVVKRQIEYLRALTSIIKHMHHDLSPDVSPVIVADILEVFRLVLRVCNAPPAPVSVRVDASGYRHVSLSLQPVLTLLTAEMSSHNPVIRRLVRESFDKLCEYLSVTKSVLLESYRTIVLDPLIPRLLPALSPAVQAGAMDTLTYFLRLDEMAPVPITPELTRFLSDACKIAETEDPQVVKSHTSRRQLVSVKVCALQLMAAAFRHAELQEHQDFRNKTISVFFKALTSRSAEILNAAKEGMREIILTEKLPKDVLQTNLRPLLTAFGDYRKLSVSLLSGLCTLLHLLNSCFSVSLGDKLMEHLRHWSEIDKLRSLKLWKESEELEVAAAIVDVFHLLPPGAHKFIEPLSLLVVELEGLLTQNTHSPFRRPLCKFFNQFPAEAAAHVVQQLVSSQQFGVLLDITQQPSSAPLRQELMKLVPQLAQRLALEEQADVRLRCIQLVYCLASEDPEWLVAAESQPIVNALLVIWRSAAFKDRLAQPDGEFSPSQLREPVQLLSCLFMFLTHEHSRVELVIELLSAALLKASADLSFVRHFYLSVLPEKYSIQAQQKLIGFVSSVMGASATNDTHKLMILQLIVLPCLSQCHIAKTGGQIFDGERLAPFCRTILLPFDTFRGLRESLRIELLRVAIALVQALPANDLKSQKRAIAEFAYNASRLEEPMVKNTAYMLLARFVEQFDSLEKMVIKVYVSLLKAHSPESRPHSKPALDVLTPTLPIRLRKNPPDPVPDWITFTVQTLAEEGYTQQPLVHIWQHIVTHQTLFRPYFHLFVSHLGNTLARIGVASSSNAEQRRTSLDVVQLYFSWLKTEAAPNPAAPTTPATPGSDLAAPTQARTSAAQPADSRRRTFSAAMGNEAASQGPSAQRVKTEGGAWQPPQSESITDVAAENPHALITENIVRLLFRAFISASESKEKDISKLVPRYLELLREGLQAQPRAVIDLEPVMRLQDSPTIILEVAAIMADLQIARVAAWLPRVQKFLIERIQSPPGRASALACEVMDKLLAVFPPSMNIEGAAEVAGFFTLWKQELETALKAVTNRNNAHTPLTMLASVAKHHRDISSTTLWPAFSAMKQLSAEHTGQSPSTAQEQQPQQQQHQQQQQQQLQQAVGGQAPTMGPPAPMVDADGHPTTVSDAQLVSTLSATITLIGTRLLPEMRKSFFVTLIELISKSKDVELLQTIARLVEQWVLTPESCSPPLQPKEKVGFLFKMAAFEHVQNAQLHDIFLNIAYNVLQSSSPIPPEMVPKLDLGFLMGLRSIQPERRNQFAKLLERIGGTSLTEKLRFIVVEKDWENIIDKFWIEEAGELLLLALDHNTPASLSASEFLFPALSGAQSPQAMDLHPDDPLLVAHRGFLSSMRNSTLGHLLMPLRTLVYANRQFAREVWLMMFRAGWEHTARTADPSVLASLSSGLHNLLAKEHKGQSQVRPNTVQVLLEGLVHLPASASPPVIAPEFLRGIAKPLSAYHSALALIERNASAAPPVASGDQARELSLTHTMLAQLYELIDEPDYNRAALLRLPFSEETKTALSFEVYNMWQRGQESLLLLMTKAAQSQLANVNPTECSLWEDHYALCARQLGQWELLADYGQSINSIDLVLEAAWRVQPVDWPRVRDALAKHAESVEPPKGVPQSYQHSLAAAAAAATQTPRMQLLQGYSVLVDQDFSRIDQFVLAGNNAVANQWALLPPGLSSMHVPLLQSMQNLAEMHESSLVLRAFATGQVTAGNDAKKHFLGVAGASAEPLGELEGVE